MESDAHRWPQEMIILSTYGKEQEKEKESKNWR